MSRRRLRSVPSIPTLRIYLRRSTERQASSLDTQRSVCKRFVESEVSSLSWGARVEYVDDDRSGTDFDGRERLSAMLRDLAPGDVVVAVAADRLGRDTLSTPALERRITVELGARLAYARKGEWIEELEDPAQAFVRVANALGADLEVRNIQARTREALRERFVLGRVAGGILFGYRNKRVTPNGGKAFSVREIIPEQADVVRRIFRERADHAGYKTIALGLNEDGIAGPKRGKRGSGSWSPSQIRSMLRNETYRGIVQHGRVDRSRTGNKRIATPADPGDIITVELPELRIVDEDLWMAVQAVNAEKAKRNQQSERRASYPLSGVARCASCGGSIGVMPTKLSGGVRVKAYGCITNRKRGKAGCSVTHRQDHEEVEKALANAVADLFLAPEVLESIVASVENQLRPDIAPDRGGLKDQLRDALNEQANLLAAIKAGGSAIPSLVAELRATDNRVRALEGALKRCRRKGRLTRAEIEKAVRERVTQLGEFLVSGAEPEARREFWRAAFPDGIEFRPTKEKRRHVWDMTGDLRVVLSNTVSDPTGT